MTSQSLQWLKTQSFKIKWNLREVHKVTQWKDGCVYRTKSIGFLICGPDYRLLSDEAQIGSVSTSITKAIQ